MRKIVVTGGAGFAGSHIVDRLCERFPQAEILVFDKMTYASDVRNISRHLFIDRVSLLVGDVADLDTCVRALQGADLLLHAAAESHVDNSFGNSLEFTRTNVVGTHCLIEACRANAVPRIVHISTDEVYGEVHDGEADERSHLRPTNPYSASKAAAEMVLQGYQQSFRVPVITVRANNIYGIRQYPEKIVPRFICHMLLDRKLPIHGTGLNRRHFLSARDFADAVVFLAERGTIGEIYNVGTSNEYTNLEVAGLIATAFGRGVDDVVEHVQDRPFNDSRYSISVDKLAAMGWRARRRLEADLPMLVDWYTDNLSRYAPLFNVGRFKPVQIPALAALPVA